MYCWTIISSKGQKSTGDWLFFFKWPAVKTLPWTISWMPAKFQTWTHAWLPAKNQNNLCLWQIKVLPYQAGLLQKYLDQNASFSLQFPFPVCFYYCKNVDFFFYPTGKMHFFHSPMTQKHLKDSPSKLKKKKEEKLHLLAKIQMEIFDSKEDFQNKIKEACENKGL